VSQQPEVGLTWNRHGPATTQILAADFLAAKPTNLHRAPLSGFAVESD
jgi:hypothetical protein